MRRRIASGHGFGNPDPVLLDNQGKINLDFMDAVRELYFDRDVILDFHVDKHSVSVGVEPTYQHDRLRIFTIDRNIDDSYHVEGIAFGPYGSGIRSKTKKYSEYKLRSKFVRLVEEWHSTLFGNR